jgi:hypothetical protein
VDRFDRLMGDQDNGDCNIQFIDSGSSIEIVRLVYNSESLSYNFDSMILIFALEKENIFTLDITCSAVKVPFYETVPPYQLK